MFVAVADQQLGFFVRTQAAGGGGLAQFGAPGAVGRLLAQHDARASGFQRGGQAAGEGGLAGAVDAFDGDQQAAGLQFNCHRATLSDRDDGPLTGSIAMVSMRPQRTRAMAKQQRPSQLRTQTCAANPAAR